MPLDPSINYGSFDADVFDRIPTYQEQMRFLFGLIMYQKLEISDLRDQVETLTTP